jgi:hypothetical protein
VNPLPYPDIETGTHNVFLIIFAWITDPDGEKTWIRIRIITFWSYMHYIFKDKNSNRSHKAVGIKFFLTIYAWWYKDPDPDPCIWLMDPDPDHTSD